MTSTTIRAFDEHARPRPTRLRITARGRAVAAVAILAPLVAGAIAFSSAPAVASAPRNATASFSYVTVEAGDSLWSIAERIAPSADPREVVTELATLNGLEGSSVSAGQSLAVPISYAD